MPKHSEEEEKYSLGSQTDNPEKEENKDTDWLDIAKLAYSQSTEYFDNNHRAQIENNLRHFQSLHHSGSKYNKEAYKYRSKLFRPKTRSAARNNEAAATAAFFSNKDVVSVEARNQNDPIQRASSELLKELLEYRLDVSIPWFLTCIGAYQDATVNGRVCGFVDWKYRDRIKTVYDYEEDPETGEKVKSERQELDIVEDKPYINIIPIENVRIHPTADWRDPSNTSPYLIVLLPMYVMDIQSRMKKVDSKTGMTKWKELDEGTIKSATKPLYDSTRATREKGKEEKYDASSSDELSPFDVAWVHMNIVRWEDGDYCEDKVYYTLGVEHLLSDPVPIEDIYFHGSRPIVLGTAVIETHVAIPSGLYQMGESVQKEINENVNQRLDNVKFVLNKRWLARRGGQVDLKSMVRNVAGSVTMVGDVERDVKQLDFRDVTSSAYKEQDLLNLDYDDLVGVFSPSTINSNRKMNETVGGMAMSRSSSGALIEYSLRTFSETFVEPVMRLLIKLEQHYETDEVVLSLAAEKANLYQKYGIDEITDELLSQDLTTRVNVGMGATDPILKLQNLVFGLKAVVEILTTAPPDRINTGEVIREIFGFLGYKDGDRFLTQIEGQEEDPEKIQLVQIIEQLKLTISELQKKLDMKIVEQQGKLAIEEKKQQGEDRRTASKIVADIDKKKMDLLNPVAGEKINALKRRN